MESMINTVSISAGANMTDRRNARILPAALGGELGHSDVVDGTISANAKASRRSQRRSKVVMAESGFMANGIISLS